MLKPIKEETRSRQKNRDAHKEQVHSFVIRNDGCVVEKA